MYSEGSDNKPDLSPRVNSARLVDYVWKHVRLACKALQVDGDRITVEASDGGQVNVLVLKASKASFNEPIESAYLEIIGRVIDPTTVQMLACLNIGSDLDMKLVNDTIELIRDPRFYTKMFC